MNTEQRFRAKVAPANAAGCQLWTAATMGRGYGKLNVCGRLVGAHRYSWSLANGQIPAGLFVLHRCDTPSCVNPDHLFLGTHAVNMADMWAKGRGVRGSEIGNAKLNEALAIEVFHAAGTLKDIGARYGIGQPQVCRIKRRKRWAHATEGLAA